LEQKITTSRIGQLPLANGNEPLTSRKLQLSAFFHNDWWKDSCSTPITIVICRNAASSGDQTRGPCNGNRSYWLELAYFVSIEDSPNTLCSSSIPSNDLGRPIHEPARMHMPPVLNPISSFRSMTLSPFEQETSASASVNPT
jgi:hypothetical protein